MEQPFSSTADAVVFAGSGEKLSLLLIQRKNPPFQNMWALPGGFLQPDEKPLDGSIRELQEETGLKLTSSALCSLSIRERSGRDPRGRVRTHPFAFYHERATTLKANDDAKSAAWIPLTQIKQLAFDHGAILCEALGKLFPLFNQSSPAQIYIRLPHLLDAGLSLEDNQPAIIFPGTFVPWHEGHSECIRQSPADLPLIVIPDSNPWKREDSTQMKYSCYWQEYLKINQQLKRDRAIVYPGFFGMEQGNPTINWINSLKFNYKSFLMGDDTIFSIEQWKEADTLLCLINKILVVPRNHSIDAINSYISKLTKKYPQLTVEVLREHPFQNISSSQIRSSLQSN
ncbi:MAG: NUDIX domain-containing protein [Bdellovibrionales bacterium]|jgi:ADP-ribose pyrophosphatase YjhB (NUDIX family)/nicotinic acid mononucleotide adenylyltransferase|nr:NUDIX domain-containing protein [Bdellovibrionales bacterium]MBT3524685.1 NUDIX domain-containing protein [Bdellovibrionales bacterium]MBT7668520.1 NUDIX domain-containing protein [Bdellovibrionales bacterium]MBT7766225.1 NUDIX domain-containing protein [Bdellovibrionales bacterium]